MKIIKLFFATILVCSITSNAQITKGNWMVGGTGSFDSYKQEETFTWPNTGLEANTVSSNIQIEISSKIGYFVKDKLVLGLTPTFTHTETKPVSGTNAGTGYSRDATFSIGPFASYYFLKPEKPFNILTEVNYQLGILSTGYSDSYKGTINRFTFLAGPEIFFNSSVGMEVLLGYNMDNRKVDSQTNYLIKNNGFQVAIGFQIHLEKP